MPIQDLTSRQFICNPNNSLAGLKLILPDICGTCGSHELAVISPNSELHCTRCTTSRGRIGPKTTRFLTGILYHFGHLGRPSEMTLKKPIGFVESIDLILQPPETAGELTSADLARHRRGFRVFGGGYS
jgi:hypothetical protein